jgi:hypothetical protein
MKMKIQISNFAIKLKRLLTPPIKSFMMNRSLKESTKKTKSMRKEIHTKEIKWSREIQKKIQSKTLQLKSNIITEKLN